MNYALRMTALAALATLSLSAAEVVSVDFSKSTGQVKPLNGICNSPLPFIPGDSHGRGGVRELAEIAELGSPFVRLHDTGGAYGRNTLVDVPNVFRDENADENDPANYDFAFTDAYLGALVKAGAKPYYRLGVTIENYYRIKAYRIHPPKDFDKYARVCEHIVRHYTKGWANGFTWDMPYWEVWCEPENKMLWLGDRHQFYELYAKVAREIKRCHPDVKVGGYGACRFESFENMDVNSDDCSKNWLGWFEEFCDYVTAEKTKAPLDFFSWHLYNRDPDRYVWHANDVRTRLDRHGLAKTEAHLTEWNFGGKFGLEVVRSITGAVYTVSCLCAFQNAPLDVATLYQASPSSTWSSVFDQFGRPTTVYFALQKFAALRALGACCETAVPAGLKLYALAAKGEKGQAFLLTNDSFTEDRTVRLDLKGANLSDFDEYRLDVRHRNFEKVGRAGSSAEIVLPWKGAVFFTTVR